MNVFHKFRVYVDRQLSLKYHVNEIASVCYHHLRRLRPLKGYQTQTTTTQLVISLVISRHTTLLQHYTCWLTSVNHWHIAACPDSRTVPPAWCWTSIADHILRRLWNSNTCSVSCTKVATLLCRAIHQSCPRYISVLSTFATDDLNQRRLRFATTGAAIVPLTQTAFADRAVSVGGRVLRNCLPPSLRENNNCTSLNTQFKAYLFDLVCNCFTISLTSLYQSPFNETFAMQRRYLLFVVAQQTYCNVM